MGCPAPEQGVHMKKWYIINRIIIAAILIVISQTIIPSQSFAAETPYDPYRQFIPLQMPVLKRHLRGVWISTVLNLDWPSKETAGLEDDEERIRRSKEELIAYLDMAVSLNMNAVFFQVSPEGDALYRSELVPWSRYLTGVFGKDPGFDPLQFIIEQARQRNLEIHAWFNPYRVSMSTAKNIKNSLEIEKSVYREHPEWIKTAANRFVIDPGIPEARRWVIDRVLEVVRRYDVDGIHFDDYFYYESSGSKLNDKETFEKYNNGQFSDIGDFRRNNTYLLIKELSQEIRTEKPWIKFGISPSGVWWNKSEHPEGSNTSNSYTNYASSFADTKKWVEEELIDYIAPQIYYSFANPRASYGETASWWAEVVKDKNVHLYIGQALYKVNDDSDKYFKGANALEEFPNQLKFNAFHSKIDGSILFRAKNMSDERKQQVVTSIQDEIWNLKALVPIMPWKGGKAPEKPHSGHAEHVDSGIKLTWSDSDPNISYYAVYRFDNFGEVIADVNAIAGYLIDTVRKSDEQVQVYQDTQPPVPGQAVYLVTALDRLHNESEGLIIKTSQSAFFNDIGPEYKWALSSIDEMYQRGIIKGDDNGFFYPEQKTKRGDFIQMLIRALGLNTEISNNFADVPPDSNYYNEVGIAKKMGIIQGEQNRFYPDEYINRQDMMVFLLRSMVAAGHEIELFSEDILNQYEDESLISNYARTAAAYLTKAGIIMGNNGKIAPMDYVTNAELAVTLYRALAAVQ
jgi:uncharacterized lipoprotein YddW (UPF0748 family)